MPDITIHPHGDRWAVREDGSDSPLKEFGTRDAAELAARDLAGGGRIEVLDEDPTGLAGAQDPGAAEPAVRAEPDVSGVEAAERARSPQTGL